MNATGGGIAPSCLCTVLSPAFFHREFVRHLGFWARDMPGNVPGWIFCAHFCIVSVY